MKNIKNSQKILIGIGVLFLVTLVVLFLMSIRQPQLEESKTVNWNELEQHIGKTIKLPESDITYYYSCPPGGGFCPPCDSDEVRGKIYPQHITDQAAYIMIGKNATSHLDALFSKNEKCKRGIISGKLTEDTWKPILPEATSQTAYYLDNAKIIKCIE